MSSELPPIHQCGCANCQTNSDELTTQQHRHMNLFLSRLNEPQRRWYLGLLSLNPAAPSDLQLAVITGFDPDTIRRGRHEIAAGLPDTPPDRQRRPGGGRPCAEKKTRTSAR